jgi:hypothetical protein
MSLFDWLFRRPRKPEYEPLVPPQPPSAGEQGGDAPRSPTPPPPPPKAETPAPEPAGDAYSATEFLPITRKEIVDAAKKGNLLSTAFQFGRQSLIPPVSDPRTKIIDRAMVTHGLLTPEELNEIHRVGEEYDKVKPTELAKTLERTIVESAKHPAAHPQLIATSSETGGGIAELRTAILQAATS